MRWRIYYASGLTYSDRDGAVELAPYAGVLAVAFEDLASGPYNTGRRYRTNFDYYGYWPTFWAGMNSLDAYLAAPGWKKVLQGLWVPDDQWHALQASLDSDDYLPPKSALAPMERNA